MRYSAAENLEIIGLVEQSSLSVRCTLTQPRSTFYAWYDRYRAGGPDGLEDRTPAPRRVWNKLPDAVAEAVLELALKEPALSPRELPVSFDDLPCRRLRAARTRRSQSQEPFDSSALILRPDPHPQRLSVFDSTPTRPRPVPRSRQPASAAPVPRWRAS